MSPGWISPQILDSVVWIQFEYTSVYPCVGNLVPSVAMEHGGAFKSAGILQGKGQFVVLVGPWLVPFRVSYYESAVLAFL